MLFVHWAQLSRLSIDDVCNPSIGRLKITLSFLETMPDRLSLPSTAVLKPEKPNASSSSTPTKAPVKVLHETDDEIIPQTRRRRKSEPVEPTPDADDATATMVAQTSEMTSTSSVALEKGKEKEQQALLPTSFRRQALNEPWTSVREHLFTHWTRITRKARPLIQRPTRHDSSN